MMDDSGRRKLAKKYVDFVLKARDQAKENDYSFVAKWVDIKGEIVDEFIKMYYGEILSA